VVRSSLVVDMLAVFLGSSLVVDMLVVVLVVDRFLEFVGLVVELVVELAVELVVELAPLVSLVLLGLVVLERHFVAQGLT